MTTYRYRDGTLTDVDPVLLNIRRAREHRAAGNPGWRKWVKFALEDYRKQGGLLEVVSDAEEDALAGSLGFHIDPDKRRVGERENRAPVMQAAE